MPLVTTPEGPTGLWLRLCWFSPLAPTKRRDLSLLLLLCLLCTCCFCFLHFGLFRPCISPWGRSHQVGSSLTSGRFPNLWAAPSLPDGTRLPSPALPLASVVMAGPTSTCTSSCAPCRKMSPIHPEECSSLSRGEQDEESQQGQGPQPEKDPQGQLGHLKPRSQPRASAPPNLAQLSIQVSTLSIPIMGQCLKAVLETPPAP